MREGVEVQPLKAMPASASARKSATKPGRIGAAVDLAPACSLVTLLSRAARPSPAMPAAAATLALSESQCGRPSSIATEAPMADINPKTVVFQEEFMLCLLVGQCRIRCLICSTYSVPE